jgi:exopolysaccharide biosynthesis operon protein EpsL
MLSSSDTPFDRSWKPDSPPTAGLAGLPPRRTVLAQCALLALALGAGTAQAVVADPGLHPYASLGYSYDDNLFRLDDRSPGYDNVRGDHSTQLQAGLLFNQTYGRQDITLQAKASRVTFEHFGQLDYNGKDLLADWVWQVGNRLSGTAGVSYSEVLAPYTDIVTRERNLRTQRHEYVTGGWGFHPSWRARLSYSRDNYKYDLASQAYNNRVDEVAEAGVDFLASSGSTIGLQADKLKRKYDQVRQVGGRPVDAGSDQDDVKLRVLWRATPVTNVQFLGGWARRTHAFFTERDASGFNAKLKANTSYDGHLGFDAALWRQFEGVESALASYAMNTGASVAASWSFSAKLQASAQAKVEKRVFNGLLSSSSGLDVNDRTHSSSVGLTYVPLRTTQVSLSVYRDARSGIATQVFGNGNYHATGVSLNVNLQY